MSQKTQNNKGLSFKRGVAAATLSFLAVGTLPATAQQVAGDSDGGLEDGELANTAELNFLTIESDENSNPVIYYNGQLTELRALAPSGTVIEYQGSWMDESNSYIVSEEFDPSTGEFFRIPLTDIPQWSNSLSVTLTATNSAGEVSSSITIPVVEGIARIEPPRPDTDFIPENAILLTGTAPAGTEVRALVNGEENESVVGFTDTRGYFTLGLSELGLADGDELALITVDPSDDRRSSASSVITVGPDSGIHHNGGWDVPPPSILYAVANGVVAKYDNTAITYILRDETGNLLGVAHARDAFNGGVFIEAPVYSGQNVVLTTRNIEGYESKVGEFEVEIQGPPEVVLDSLSIDPENPVVSGSTEPDADVILSIGSGANFRTIAAVKADTEGKFSVTLPEDDEVVTELKPFDVRVTGAYGTTSPVRVYFVGTDMDYTAPDIPESFTDGVLEGSTRANFAVKVFDTDGNEVASTTADENGSFVVNLDGFPEATTFTVIGIDKSGNETPQARTMVADVTAPTGTVGVVDAGQQYIDIEVKDDATGVNVTVLAEDEETVLDSVEGLRAPNLYWLAEIPGYDEGTILYVQFSDGAGNLGERVEVVVGAQLASFELLVPSVSVGDTTISGTLRGFVADDHGEVTVYADVNGAMYETGVNPADNSFSFQLDEEILQNDIITIWAATEDGTQSESVTVEVIADQIGAPRLNNAEAGHTTISGIAHNAEKVRLYDESGDLVLSEVDADAETFRFSFEVDPLISDDVYYVAGVDRFGVEGLRTKLTVGQSITIVVDVDPVTAGQTSVSGTTSPGANVDVIVNGGVPSSAVAEENGRFTVELSEALVDGDAIRIIASVDRASRIVNLEVGDSIAPEAPIVYRPNNKSEEITGQAEPNATVSLFVNGSELAKVVADRETGVFSYPLETPLRAGSILRATATDAAGNVSEPTEVTVEDVIPSALEVNHVEYGDKVITGTADAGADISIFDNNRNEVATGKADSDGIFSIEVSNLGLNDYFTVQASRSGGPATEQTVQVKDTIAPEIPGSIRYQNDNKTLTGVAEPGATVMVYRLDAHTHFASAEVDEDGFFYLEIGDLPVGTEIFLEAVDASGNASTSRLRVIVPERDGEPDTEEVPGDNPETEDGEQEGGGSGNNGGTGTSVPDPDDIVYQIDEDGNLVPVTSAAENLEQTGSDAARAAGVAVLMFAIGGAVFTVRRRLNDNETT